MSRIFLSDRLGALRRVTSAALLCGIALSFNLWFPISRSIPRAPLLIALPQQVVPAVEYFLSSLLAAALVALIFAKRPMKYFVVAIVALVLLCLLDQTRLQPWVYQYLTVFVLLALGHQQSHDEGSTVLTLLQLIVASLYFWGGLQKLNYSFSHEVLSQLVTPILALSPSQLSALGVGIATIEIFTGLGLLWKKTREICICLALAMHGTILGLLIAQNQNSVVWAWNGALVLMVVVLFWRSDTSIGQVFTYWRVGNIRRALQRALVIVTALYVVLPVFSFWGWWDLYLSGALYSGNTPVGVVRVAGPVYDRLAPIAKQQVFVTSSGERMLPLHEWSMAELNVPPYPQLRVYQQLTREICRSAEDSSQAELIVKTRPAIMDGSYKVVRMDCSALDINEL